MSRRKVTSQPPTTTPQPPGYCGKMPLFGLGINKKGFIVAAGGGGSSKTGIPNGLIFFKQNQDNLEKIGEHKTTGDAIMGLDVHPNESSVVYVDNGAYTTLQVATGGTVIGVTSQAHPSAQHAKVLRFNINNDKEDFKPDLLAVGCFDGELDLLEYPSLKTVCQLPKAHSEDIDDVAWSKDSKTLATTSKDKTCKLWKVTGKTLTPAHTLSLTTGGATLIPRGCRFSPVSPTRLYVSAFLLGKATYVAIYDTESQQQLKLSKIHNTHATSFALSALGTYVAVGDVEGAVVVARADSLSRVLQVKPHGFVVPALAFTPLPSKSASKKKDKKEKDNTQSDSSAVVSVGADYGCMYTPIVQQSFINTQQILLILSIIVILIAVLMKLLG